MTVFKINSLRKSKKKFIYPPDKLNSADVIDENMLFLGLSSGISHKNNRYFLNEKTNNNYLIGGENRRTDK